LADVWQPSLNHSRPLMPITIQRHRQSKNSTIHKAKKRPLYNHITLHLAATLKLNCLNVRTLATSVLGWIEGLERGRLGKQIDRSNPLNQMLCDNRLCCFLFQRLTAIVAVQKLLITKQTCAKEMATSK